MLKLDAVRFSYQDASPFQFNFALEAGQCLLITGESGSGKSTLLNLVAGFLQPDAGEISFSGVRLDRLMPAQRPLTVLFQEHNLFNHLNVYENIALGISPALKLSPPQKKTIAQALEQLGLGGMQRRAPEDLSGGQRQRVALARCLVRSKPLLLLDEPFIGLNDELKLEIGQLIQNLQQQLKLTILWVTHDPGDARAMADHTATIDKRSLHFTG